MSRIALVTGAGTGIGRGIALALARRGVGVALAGRRRERLVEVSEEISHLPMPASTAVMPVDLAEAHERAKLVRQVHQQMGAVDILVNNAGIANGGDLASLRAEDIERSVAVNLAAPIDLTRLLQPDLAAGHGSIVFVVSNARLLPLPSASLYTATKSALGNLAESLRYELEPLSIHLLVAYPPDSDTAMLQSVRRANHLHWPPLAAPEQVGEVIVTALEERRRELHWGRRERLMVSLREALPWLVQALFRWQRKRFAFLAASVEDKHHSGIQ